MGDSISYGDLVRVYGLDGVVIYPAEAAGEVDSASVEFLRGVGMPSDGVFASCAGVVGSGCDSYVLGPLFDLGERYCPPESRPWRVLGYLPAALIALVHHSDAVYIFPEGERDYQLAHRDVV